MISETFDTLVLVLTYPNMRPISKTERIICTYIDDKKNENLKWQKNKAVHVSLSNLVSWVK